MIKHNLIFMSFLIKNKYPEIVITLTNKHNKFFWIWYRIPI